MKDEFDSSFILYPSKAYPKESATEEDWIMTRVLYLRGLNSRPEGPKVQTLSAAGYQVIEPPTLPYPNLKTTREPRTLREVVTFLSDLRKVRAFGASGAFGQAVQIAQDFYHRAQPDLIIGLSMGAALAMNLDAGQTPRVLLAPGWHVRLPLLLGRFRFGQAETIPPLTILLHSARDRVIRIGGSKRLLRNSEFQASPQDQATVQAIQSRLAHAGYDVHNHRLIVIGKDHRLNEQDPRDRRNRNPHPHAAMLHSARILLELRKKNA